MSQADDSVNSCWSNIWNVWHSSSLPCAHAAAVPPLSSLSFQSEFAQLQTRWREENTLGQTSTKQRTFWDFVAVTQIYVDLISPVFLQAAAFMHTQGNTPEKISSV